MVRALGGILVLSLTLASHTRAAEVRPISPPPATAGPAVIADGSSDNTAISQDDRETRLVAFDSAASNLLPGDVNGKRDVFVLFKRRPSSPNDRVNRLSGRLALASVGDGLRPGNGDSSHPSLDGTFRSRPHCVAFQSTATNLHPGDRRADSDVFVRDLRTNRTLLVSVGHSNAIGASVDGRCSRVAYEADGVVYVRDLRGVTLRIARGHAPDLQADGFGLAYEAARQVWYQRLGRSTLRERGRARLVSDTREGRPGNGPSGAPSVSDHGTYVAFESRATDLCPRRCYGTVARYPDLNLEVSDVFRRTVAAPADTPGAMQLASLGRYGGQLDGDSLDPQISRAGRAVVFESLGKRVGAGEPLPGWSVYQWYQPSTTDGGRLIQEPSRVWGWDQRTVNPSISARGNYIAFTAMRPTGIGDAWLEFVGFSHEGHPVG